MQVHPLARLTDILLQVVCSALVAQRECELCGAADIKSSRYPPPGVTRKQSRLEVRNTQTESSHGLAASMLFWTWRHPLVSGEEGELEEDLICLL